MKRATTVVAVMLTAAMSPTVSAQNSSQSGGLPQVRQDVDALAALVATLQQQVNTLQQQITPPQGPPFTLANLKGTYAFIVEGHGNAFVNVNGLALQNAPCTTGVICPTLMQTTFPTLTPNFVAGTLTFDGAGHITGGNGTCYNANLMPLPPNPSTFPPSQTWAVVSDNGFNSAIIHNITGTYDVAGPFNGGSMSLTVSGDPACAGSVNIEFILGIGGNSGVFWNFFNGQGTLGYGSGNAGSFVKQSN